MLAVPPNSLPTVVITEVMYDAPGADTGHEWVEFQNAGADPVTLSGWKFFEGGVNHKLIAQRSATLAAGDYAVIADDAKKFSADYPAYAGALFQSSFSLSNTGETVALKDASSTEITSASYTSAAGANGDGNTLNFVSGAWVARRPSPGSAVSPAVVSVPKTRTKTPSNPAKPQAVVTQKEASTSSVATAPQSFGILPWIFGLAAVIMVGTGVIFLAPKKKPEDEYNIVEDT